MNTRRRFLSIGCAGLAGFALQPASAKAGIPAENLPSTPSTAGTPAASNAVRMVAVDQASSLRPLPGQRILSLRHMHTGEFESFALARGQAVDSETARRFNRFMRDHHNGVVGNMDPELIHHLLDLQSSLEMEGHTIDVLSAYRSPATNAMLRKRSTGVARFSMHLEGKAIDLNLPGTKTREMFDAAVDLKAGGVGLYRRSGFIHFDTGRVRHWG